MQKRALLIFLHFAFCILHSTAHAELTTYATGNREDVRPRLHGPALDLAGGGGDHAEAMQATIDAVRGCSRCDTKVDMVVIRASGGSGYNPFFMKLDGVDSVLTMVITDRASANRADVARNVRNAEVVFFAGGDQCNYIRWIKGTAVGEAVKAVYRRGGGVGGTSAGLAIQADVVYDACPSQSAKSPEVLRDPFHVDVSLSRDFFRWRHMERTVTDTHFMQRGRMGRLLVFLARAIPEHNLRDAWGLGVDEATSVVLFPDGKARVFGGSAYLIHADRQPEVLERGKPLTYRGYKVWKFDNGQMFDLAHRPTVGYRTIDVVEGEQR